MHLIFLLRGSPLILGSHLLIQLTLLVDIGFFISKLFDVINILDFLAFSIIFVSEGFIVLKEQLSSLFQNIFKWFKIITFDELPHRGFLLLVLVIPILTSAF